MPEAKSLKNRFQTIARIENRMLCPACPVAVERAVFLYDFELGNKLIQFVVRNNGERPVAGATVLFRCFDGGGNCLYPGERPDFAITYHGLTCPPGEYFADRRAVRLFSYDIVNYRACVTEVVFADGQTQTFAPGDYIERPARSLLCDLCGEAEERALRRAWGKRARCVPIDVGQGLWMCTCGQVCQTDACPVCGCTRAALSPYFGDEATAAFATARARRGKRVRLAVTVTLLAALAAGGGAAAHHAVTVDYPAATARVTDLFLAEGRYNEAIGFARGRHDAACLERALCAAADAALAGGDYAGALRYDSIRQTPDPERIYRAAAADAAADPANPNYTAAGYGLLTGDAAVYDSLIHMLIDDCKAHGLYRQAARYTRMLHDLGRETQIAVFDQAIADSLAQGNDEEALSWAEQHPSGTRYDEVLSAIVSRCLTAGDLASALKWSTCAEDDTYLLQVRDAADEAFIAAHIGQFYFTMPEAERRARHASPLALCRDAAYIDGAGSVRGLADVNWDGAVSLAMNEFHTLCLFADGHVEATGHTGYGRCSVSSWSSMVDVAAGERHSVGLRADGRVSAVGDNSDGQCNVSGWGGIIDVAAGRYHTLGLRADGTVLATGNNACGQCNVTGYTDVIAVAAGDWVSVLLHRDGSVTLLGGLTPGMADAAAWENVVDVAAGNAHILARFADGSVRVAGTPVSGSPGSPEGWSDVTAIAAGSVCIAGLRADGSLYLDGDGAPELRQEGGGAAPESPAGAPSRKGAPDPPKT